MELYVEPKWAVRPKERKPHPLKGTHKWTTDDPGKRARILEALRKGAAIGGRKSTTKGRPSPKRIPVSVYDLDGNYVTTCQSIRDAAEKYVNGNMSRVAKCIHGINSRAGQYQFRRANVVEFMGEKLVKKSPIEPYKRKRRKPDLITN